MKRKNEYLVFALDEISEETSFFFIIRSVSLRIRLAVTAQEDRRDVIQHGVRDRLQGKGENSYTSQSGDGTIKVRRKSKRKLSTQRRVKG